MHMLANLRWQFLSQQYFIYFGLGCVVAAAVCWGVGEPLKVEEIQVEPPKFSEIRVKVLCASLCHTDTLYAEGSLIVSITTCLTSYQLTVLIFLLISPILLFSLFSLES
jgi:hypothetical protein